MDDPFFVCGFKGVCYLQAEGERFLPTERTANEPLREILTLDHFQDEKALAVHMLETVNSRYVGVVERREYVGLALKTGQPLGVVSQRIGEKLEGHVAAQAGVVGAENLSHSALPDLLYNSVMCQLLVGHDVCILARVSRS